MIVAFIGTRDLSVLPPSVIEKAIPRFIHLATEVARHGDTIITGAAKGADQLAAHTALNAWGQVILVLPWKGYEEEWIASQSIHFGRLQELLYNPKNHSEWTESVQKYHPNLRALTRGAVALHARNYGIIKNASKVIALPGWKKLGGTGQGIRIAVDLGIPVLDLTHG